VEQAGITGIDLGAGTVDIAVDVPRKYLYQLLSRECGEPITSEAQLLPMLASLTAVKREYDRLAGALEQVQQTGYGIVMPTVDQLRFEEPEIVRSGGKYGVKLRASAPSIHLIRADIETEIAPVVGSEKQSEDLIHYLLSEFEDNPKEIWKSNIFGKSLSDLVNEGLNNKLYRMPDSARCKLQETLQRIINEGSGGLICIIL
jgi:stage IV sporulation protein A